MPLLAHLKSHVVRKYLATTVEPSYQRHVQLSPKSGLFKTPLIDWLEFDAKLPKNQRRTAMRLYQGLVELGYLGAYDSIQRVVKQWKVDNKKSASSKQAFVPLAFQPGEVC